MLCQKTSSLLVIKVSKSLSAIGFLTALEDAQHGFFGGYLVLSDWGRPLEFHCSTPVLPNQAQRILYGQSLGSYVLSDLIGQTLLGKAQLPVQAIFTDQRDMLGLTLLRDDVIVCVESEDRNGGPSENLSGPQLLLAGYRLYGTPSCIWQPSTLEQSVATLVAHVDLAEPFERIRGAIREAQRITDETPDERHASSDAA